MNKKIEFLPSRGQFRTTKDGGIEYYVFDGIRAGPIKKSYNILYIVFFVLCMGALFGTLAYDLGKFNNKLTQEFSKSVR